MNIIICSSKTPFIQGGNEIVIDWLSKELMKRGFNIDIISLPLCWKKEEDIIKTYLMWKLFNLNESLEICPDLVICTKFPSYVVNHFNKVVWLFHQFRQVYDWAGMDLGYTCDTVLQLDIKEKIIEMDNQAFKEAKKLYAISYNVAKRLKKYNNIEAEVIYPFPPNKEDYRCVDYGDYFLHVGRLEKNKRVDLVIEAIKKISFKMNFIIVGEGTEKRLLEEKVLRYGLEDKVKFLGWVDRNKLLELYANAYGILFTAYDEDYGLIIPEAFLCKKAIITLSDSGGATELVRDKENGIVCLPNIESLADGINEAVLNKEKIIEMGNNGYNIVNSWSWDYIINRLIF